jgi:hypothetical protein
MVAAGASIARERGDDNGFTVAAHGGVMRRTASFVEEVGVVGYANLNPLGAGPALRGKIAAAIDVTAGGLWMTDEAEGFRWFVGGGLSLALLGDLPSIARACGCRRRGGPGSCSARTSMPRDPTIRHTATRWRCCISATASPAANRSSSNSPAANAL